MRFAVTQAFPCSYLSDRQEQVLLHLNDEPISNDTYTRLLQNGFRRSGDALYRPHCPACNACQSLRVLVSEFEPSRNQRRILSRNHDLTVTLQTQSQDDYYPLFEAYIHERHSQGSMFPPSVEQYRHFINSYWADTRFMDIRLKDRLVAVAITDTIGDGLSALYTFFDSALQKRSLGTFAILQQIALAKELQKPHLYLGYQIDECNKMNYKARFQPNQRFIGNKWL
ncbi:arginyltransferase [Lacimicrobium sp. SS2-24]|uniref:arginyltransferase n=1 Tax=Lacimicrobium sp. SS2-24 TaxID=2005569 RepID=UPI000B4B3156|nr:arginyltransferase [Lacimicrobium sp. SS2-24]